MKQIISIIVMLLILVACTDPNRNNMLIEVESYIDTNPDSALTVLQNIDVEKFSSKSDHAKYALLYSISLDKNYIKKTDFEVLQPAIDYFKNNGTYDDQMRTDYYEGRIFINKGEDIQAMGCFLKALERGKNSSDTLTLANTLFELGNIYSKLYKFDKFIDVNLKAAELYHSVRKPDSYANCLLRAVNGYILINDTINAKKYIDICKELLPTLTMVRQADFYAYNLTYAALCKDCETTTQLINEYISVIPYSLIDWLTVANAYLQLEQYDKAYEVIKKHKLSSQINERIRYYSVLSSTLKRQKKYQEALDSYDIYTHLTDSIELAVFEADAQFSQERHLLEAQAIQEREAKHRMMWLALAITFVLFVVIIIVRLRLKVNSVEKKLLEEEKEKYRLQCLQVEEERDNLTDLLSKNNELSAPIKNALITRVTLLNKFFTAYIVNKEDINPALYKEMSELTANKDTFMDSTRLAFEGSHPKFIKYLKEHGLSEWEINYCCLYAIGLRGKEVGAYIKMRSHYNISSAIREKLGINEHDTNLGIFIRKLLNNIT